MAVTTSVPQFGQISGKDRIVEPLTWQERPLIGSPLLEATKAVPEASVFAKKSVPAVLVHIAMCESRNKQFDDAGNALRGHNPQDIGKYQINLMHWGREAEKLGHDLTTEEGNEAMALELYRRQGTKPWVWSKACWDKTISAQTQRILASEQ